MKRTTPFIVIFSSLLLLFSILPSLITGQTGVTAEAIGQANLRAQPTTDSAQVGEIFSGTIYPVVGRSELLPWILLGDPTSSLPFGWVFQDLMTITGDLNQVPVSTQVVNEQPPTQIPDTTADPSGASPTPAFTVAGIASGEINIRYGPGVDYDRVGVAQAGERFQITAYHTQYDWVQLRYENSPNDLAWVARELLDYEGDIYTLPAISQTAFNFPTLTPTFAPIYDSSLPSQQTVPLSPAFQALASDLWELIVERGGFDPATSRIGALYVQDLQTGEAFTFGNDISFSGTSINKIPILLDVFNVLPGPPDPQLAVDILNTMICSENVATNRLLSLVGDGNALDGTDHVTAFMRSLGLENTFIAAPYDTTTGIATATPIPRAPNIPTISADGSRTNPDPVNQLTVDEMGWLLSSAYQCAVQETGPLLSQGGFTPQECRRAIHVMSNNTVDALLRAGVPADVQVAHKHGWIADTHGNAGIFFTPGGDYVMTIMLHQPTWLEFNVSLPLMAEASRMVYNYFNSTAPMPNIRDGFIPETADCNYFGDPLVEDITSPFFQATYTPLDSPFATQGATFTPTFSPTPTPQPTQQSSPSPSPTATFLG